MKRNPAIELWRIFCMLAVVVSHVLVNNGVGSFDGFMWHIPGFLIITGFFGTRFSFKKVVALLLTVYACYWLTIPFRPWTGITALLLPHGGWFVPFYLALLALSPIMNAALENEKAHKPILLSVLALLLISWVPRFLTNGHMNMLTIEGMWGNTIFFMLAIYLLARLFAIYRIGDKFTFVRGGGVFIALIVGCWLMGKFVPRAIDSYSSPLAIATAFAGFGFFSRLRLPEKFGRVICFVSPSMFGVYLVHECCVRDWQVSPFAAQSCGHALLWACGLFVVCLAIDLIRRAVFFSVGILWEKIWRDGFRF